MTRTSIDQAKVATGFTGVSGGSVVISGGLDVGAARERRRRGRTWWLTGAVGLVTAYLWARYLGGQPIDLLALPTVPQLDATVWIELVFIITIVAVMVGTVVLPGRSSHQLLRPEQIETRLADVKGLGPVVEETVRSLNLFLAHKTFAGRMGGTPRRGLLFEGAPGTGKTHLAKAMAHEAGVPFLFISATAFQSSFYGATAKKIRSYFKALRKAAYAEGGAIGFIEEIDAIGMARGGMAATAYPADRMTALRTGGLSGACATAHGLLASDPGAPAGLTVNRLSENSGAIVNELLVQLQSFDQLTGLQRLDAAWRRGVNQLLPVGRQLRLPLPRHANVLLIAATNRADNLDPALIRPGRFDRRLSFELPAKADRRELVDHFLARKAHETELDEEDRRDTLAGITMGYTPVMIEHLLDEALVNAVRRGAEQMSWPDVERARLTEEVGLGQPVAYTVREKRLIATHEAGHATAAWLLMPERRLEVLSIIKRKSALGLLAHGDREEEYTRSRADLVALTKISLAGQAAEEIFFGDVSTGPGGDLVYATQRVAEMVGVYGMAGSLVSYGAVQSGPFDATNIVGRVLGDRDGRASVESLLGQHKQAVRALLADHRHLVEALRDALLVRDELVGREIEQVLEDAELAQSAAVVVPAVVVPAVVGSAVVGPAADLRGAQLIDLRDPAPAAATAAPEVAS